MLSILAPKKSRVRFSNIMEIRQLPSSHALEAKLSRMSYPTVKDQESILKTVGKLTATQVAKISFFFCFVVGVCFLRFIIVVYMYAMRMVGRGRGCHSMCVELRGQPEEVTYVLPHLCMFLELSSGHQACMEILYLLNHPALFSFLCI